MLTQGLNKSVEDCMQDRDNCRGSVFSNSDFYCTDVTTLGALLWFLLMVLPTLCLNSGILIFTLRKQFVNVVSMWPPFIFSGNFSPFLFGPVTGRNGFALSPWLTGANIMITCCQATVASVLLNKMKGNILSTSSCYYISKLNIFLLFRTRWWESWPKDCDTWRGLPDHWPSDHDADISLAQHIFQLQPTCLLREGKEGFCGSHMAGAIQGWSIGSGNSSHPKIATDWQNICSTVQDTRYKRINSIDYVKKEVKGKKSDQWKRSHKEQFLLNQQQLKSWVKCRFCATIFYQQNSAKNKFQVLFEWWFHSVRITNSDVCLVNLFSFVNFKNKYPDHHYCLVTKQWHIGWEFKKKFRDMKLDLGENWIHEK